MIAVVSPCPKPQIYFLPMTAESNELDSPKNPCALPQGEHQTDCQAASNYVKRSNILASCIEAIRYISVLPRKRFRYSDRVTDILGAISILLLLVIVVMPTNAYQMPLMLFCDGLFLLTVVVFTMNRLGILNSLSERQFLLVWDIILGAFLLGLLFSANSTLILNYMKHLPKTF